MVPRMRDPRLVEIDFLMDLELAGSVTVRSTQSLDTTGRQIGQGFNLYGITPFAFRDLVLHLLQNGMISGGRSRTVGGRGLNPPDIDMERYDIIKTLTSGQPIDVYMTHAGRIRLWDLRDALIRDPDLEPMGLRSKAAWERDLFLRLRFASPSTPLAILFVDLDDFGKVNKQLGHAVGDDVLLVTFGLVKNLVGARGAAYRCGGEEIGILLPDTDQAGAEALAHELRATIESEVLRRVPALGKPQTASIGAGSFKTSTDARDAITHVDGLMRTSKTTGKNRVTSKPFAE
jgi:diguanylate cyclase (GGDEF)-like protein